MIKNERQYKITQAELKKFEQEIAQIDRADPTLHPRQILGRINSLNRTIQTLKTELTEYEQLKNAEVAPFHLNSFAEIPIALIKARITAGMTQKQLAEKIGIQEQQIQRYEANDYASISFARLVEIAQILGVNIRAELSIVSEPTVSKLGNG
jgi:DNA-binding XRE family transcriptional regulator